MRRITLWMLALCMTFAAQAQIQTPKPSPTATLSQEVGLSTVTVTYSRPGVKDRTIFGELVPYDKVWRTGANESTKLTLSDDMKIGGQDVPAGTYALYTIPGKDSWTIIIHKNTSHWGDEGYDKAEDLVRFEVKPEMLEDAWESFTIDFSDFTPNGANMNLIWDHTKVSFPIMAPTDKKVEAQIKRILSPNTMASNYSQAAGYYLQTNKDLDQALDWINKSLALFEEAGQSPFWVYHVKAKILMAQNNYKEAIKIAEKSKELAAKAENDFGYVALNEKLIKECKSKM